MADGKSDYRVINLLGASFRFRIKRLETEFMFADGSVHIFPNWDVKSCRERFYMEEYINVSADEYLRMATESGEIVEFGIKTSEVKRFIEQHWDFFEGLLLGEDKAFFGKNETGLAGPGRLDSKENL
jgi:hypothetical protein